MSNFKKGDVYHVTVKEILPTGVKVEILPREYGFIKKKDFVFSKLIEDLHEVVSINDKVEAIIEENDYGDGYIFLNHNKTKKDPWDEIEKRHFKGQIADGIVTEVRDNGIIVEISKGIEGFVPNHEIFDKNVMLQKIELWEKDHVKVKINSISKETKIIKLSVKDVFQENNEKLAIQNRSGTGKLGDVIGDILDLFVEKSETSQNIEWLRGKHSIRTILLVDDEPGILEHFPQMLKLINQEFEIDAEKSIEEAIKLYRKRKFDLIITDLFFPKEEIDGYDFIEKIHASDDEQLICVLSGNKNIDYKRLMKYDLAGILEKPVDPAEVRDALQNIKSGNFFHNLKKSLNTNAYEIFYRNRESKNTYEIQLNRLLKNIESFSEADFVAILKMDPISKNITLEKKTGNIKTKGIFEWNNLKKSPVTDVMHEKEFIFRNYIENRAPEKFKNFIKHIDAESFIGVPLFSISDDEYGLFLIKNKGRIFNDDDYNNAKNRAHQVEKLIDYMNFDFVLNKESKVISTGQLSAALIHEIKNSMQVLSGQVDQLREMVNSILNRKIDISNPQGKSDLAKLTNKIHKKKASFFKLLKALGIYLMIIKLIILL
jgi:DNA-binding NarL/FixJ family response regulator/predicted RNA-binding protein with RPS1 domain